MKYTLNDLTGASYTRDPDSKIIDLAGVEIAKGNIYAIINVTTNTIMYRVNQQGTSLSMINPTRIDLGAIDLAGMTHSDELMIILDMPLQKDVQVVNTVGVNVLNQLALNELENLNDTLLEMLSNIEYLGAIRWSLNSIRAELVNSITVASGTITTVTTVTTVGTVSNITSVWWVNAQPMVGALQNLLVANAITSNLSFS